MWNYAVWVLLGDWVLRILLSVVVIVRSRKVGSTLAWLMIILLFPVLGTGIYLLLGENRLARSRATWARKLRTDYRTWQSRQAPFMFANWKDPQSDLAQLSRMIGSVSDALPLGGNHLELLTTPEKIFEQMIADINAAKTCCYLEYYIWEVGGLADELANCLATAARRGVDCKVLVDAVGSRGFLRSRQARSLREAGVQIHAALPVNIFRAFLYRFDLRIHRKLVIIDDQVGYTGSQNMADPKLFRRGAGFGQWIDAMVRMKGPAVDALLMVFVEDWFFETASLPFDQKVGRAGGPSEIAGNTVTQVVPSGPGLDSEAIIQILIGAIYAADHQLTITTPYLVPDDSLQRALVSAARRGVDVTIVIPRRVDSWLVRLASRELILELAQAGVRIARYERGMLHTKSISIDGEISFFGSLNLDPRSLLLNFELMLVLYDTHFTSRLIALQHEYTAHSHLLDPAHEPVPAFPIRFLESCARLLSPLL